MPDYEQINIQMSPKRKRVYLQALRERYRQPTWGFSRLIPRALREVYALHEQGKEEQDHDTPRP